MTKIIITIEIGEPKKKAPRDIIVAGAPVGEMPIIKTGTFANRHVLVDAIYAELQRREPQVPKHVEPKPEKKAPALNPPVATLGERMVAQQPATSDAQTDEADDASEPAMETTVVSGPPKGDQLVAAQPDDLPVIDEPAGEPPSAPAINELEAAIYATKSE